MDKELKIIENYEREHVYSVQSKKWTRNCEKKEHYIKIAGIQKTGNFVNENVVLELNNNKKAYK